MKAGLERDAIGATLDVAVPHSIGLRSGSTMARRSLAPCMMVPAVTEVCRRHRLH